MRPSGDSAGTTPIGRRDEDCHLEPGARFRFAAFPEQTATLLAKTLGRALIRYDARRDQPRTFEATVRTKDGQKLSKRVTIDRSREVEPCALGADVEVLDAEKHTAQVVGT